MQSLKRSSEAVAGSVTLVAQSIEHAPGIDLPAAGSDGDTGATGFASHTMKIPGGPGTGGANGNNATDAGSIKIVVQRLRHRFSRN
jgi:hypothetical protein